MKSRIIFLLLIFISHNYFTLAQDLPSSKAAFIEKNKEILQDFDEVAAQKIMEQRGVKAEVKNEVLTSLKIKYIESKLGNTNKVQAAYSDLSIPGCANLGFDLGDFTNWAGWLGDIGSSTTWASCPDPASYTPGFVTGTPNLSSNIFIGSLGAATLERQVILTCAHCYDTLARNPLNGTYDIPFLAPGGSGVSVRLGNTHTMSETERLSYNLKVDASNTKLKIKYAIVFEHATSHQYDEEPFFIFDVKDSLGATVSGLDPCGNYCYSADLNLPGFITLPSSSIYTKDLLNDIIYYKWTSHDYDLTAHIGQTLTIEFTTGDCSLGGHWGYAYIDASCSARDSLITINPMDTVLTITAPSGFSNYQWFNAALNQPIPGANSQTISITNPISGASYSVKELPTLACAKIAYYKLIDYTGIKEETAAKSIFNLFPNPTKEVVNISYVLNENCDVVIEIKNLLGQLLIQKEYTKESAGRHITNLNSQDLLPGIYLVSLTINGEKTTQKIILE